MLRRRPIQASTFRMNFNSNQLPKPISTKLEKRKEVHSENAEEELKTFIKEKKSMTTSKLRKLLKNFIKEKTEFEEDLF